MKQCNVSEDDHECTNFPELMQLKHKPVKWLKPIKKRERKS